MNTDINTDTNNNPDTNTENNSRFKSEAEAETETDSTFGRMKKKLQQRKSEAGLIIGDRFSRSSEFLKATPSWIFHHVIKFFATFSSIQRQRAFLQY